MDFHCNAKMKKSQQKWTESKILPMKYDIKDYNFCGAFGEIRIVSV